MTKKHFIELANTIRSFNAHEQTTPFTDEQISALADFCRYQNAHFNRGRWLAYIAGECGPNGGRRK